MKSFADVQDLYSVNEVTIYWNSPAVFVAAYLLN
ncbi:MAG: glycoside hydrolase family 9 protein [Oscillospiraceae bacterium]|nr:glycoside hydrolase family 9 protein [Oscillospiraceae bacterium]